MTKEMTTNPMTVLMKNSGIEGENLFRVLLADVMKSVGNYGDVDFKADVMKELLENLKPQDCVELMLIAQLMTCHRMGINYLERMEKESILQHQQHYLSASTKLMRLYSEKLESLMRYRRKGQQVVQVEHVHINGNAIVGNVGVGAASKHEESRA